jgi:protein-tyrosine phosphatase
MTQMPHTVSTGQRDRLLPLAGGRNFRDLGGYRTEDGRQVRWGKLYRSGVLAYLTEDDHQQLAAHGIRVICDLRTAHERQREPSRWRGTSATQLSWDYDSRMTSLRHHLPQDFDPATGLTPEMMRQTMLRLYSNLPALLRAQFAALFQQLDQGGTPLLFHCSAGKDRTGIAAALILSLLGVPRETIVADYVMTNDCVDLEALLSRHKVSSIGVGDDNRSLFPQLNRAARKPLIAADPDYLETALRRITDMHGSVEAYLYRELGLSAVAAARIRASLLES